MEAVGAEAAAVSFKNHSRCTFTAAPVSLDRHD